MTDEPMFLTVRDVRIVHQRVIDTFGGDAGLRDRGLLESAVAMPRAVFGGAYLHEGLAAMAAAYHFHLCRNHPFMDGNKRVALAVAELFLLLNGAELVANDDAVERLTMGVAAGTTGKDEVIAFFVEHVIPDQ
jgi:death-on-curing protein